MCLGRISDNNGGDWQFVVFSRALMSSDVSNAWTSVLGKDTRIIKARKRAIVMELFEEDFL